MKDEYFDIVDEHNNLTNERRLRSEVHSNGIWHRTVHIYFFRKRGNDFEFLVHLRSKNKDLHPNCWDTRFGGHIKSGETVSDAVVGEVEEELGLNIDIKKLLMGSVQKRDYGMNKEFTYNFFYNFDGKLSDLKFTDGEVQEIKWFIADDIIGDMSQHPEHWSGNATGFLKVVTELKKTVEAI